MALAGAVAYFGYQTFTTWFAKGNLSHQGAQKTSAIQTRKKATLYRTPPFRTFEVIAQKNLFASDRREKMPTKPQAPSRSKPPSPLDRRFALFGIVIDGNVKKALVSNLNKKVGPEKAYIWVKIGDRVGNLQVSDITPEQIIVIQKGYEHIVRLSDKSQPQKRSIKRNVTRQTRTNNKKREKPKVVRPTVKKTDGSL